VGIIEDNVRLDQRKENLPLAAHETMVGFVAAVSGGNKGIGLVIARLLATISKAGMWSCVLIFVLK
jgi:hypothetical protein